MNCEELQFELPLYADGVLTESVRESVELHLPSCPLCRQALADYRLLKTDIGQLAYAEMPFGLESSIKRAFSERLDTRPVITIAGSSHSSLREKVLHWLMPYSIGTVAASVFMIAFLFVLMSDLQSSVDILDARSNAEPELLLANANTEEVRQDLQLPAEYGGVRIATSPPALNPAGALFALTKSIVRGDIKDEEVVIVADVFGNGLASIAEVVDPPQNATAMRELEKAFATDPASAPFMPSKMDKDVTKVRVVLRIQRVEVTGN